MKSAYILGTCAGQEDLTEFVADQLEYHCDVPYQIFDMDVIEENIGVSGWFLKPFVLREAVSQGYDRVIWLDNDLEILDSIDPLFDDIEDNKVLVCRDHYLGKVWNTGIVGISKNYPEQLMKEWIASCKRKDRRGDQECLHAVATKYGLEDNIKEMAHEYHGQRLMPEEMFGQHDYKVMHWTGPVGKEHIRKNLL